MTFLDYIKQLDYFAYPLELKFHNKKQFSSILGLVLTIAILGLAIAIAITSGKQLFNKVQPNVNYNTIYSLIAENYTIDTYDLPFTVSTETDISKLIDPHYFNVDFQHYQNTKWTDPMGKPIIDKIRKSLEYELCGLNQEKYQDRFNRFGNFSEILNLDTFDKHLCLKRTNITIGGAFKSDFFSNIRLQVQKCINSTVNNNFCKPEEEINKLVNGFNIMFNYIHSIPNTPNYTFPFTPIYTNYYMKMDPSIYQTSDIYFSRVNITTDAGFLFEEMKSKVEWQFDRFREIYIVNPPPNDKIVIRIYLNISGSKIMITRYYMKVQELIALVGGILKVCILIGSVITRFFSQFLFEEMLINNFFDYKTVEVIESKAIKPVYSNETLKLVNIKGRKMKELNPEIKVKKINKKDSRSYKENVLPSDIETLKSKDRELKEIKDLKSIKTTVDGLRMNILGEKIEYHMDYLDVINIVFCPCRSSSKQRNAIHKMFQDKLSEYCDYSEVINEVISFRYFKEHIISSDYELTKQAKVKIDFNPYSINENPNLKVFIQSFQYLTKEKLINEKMIKKMYKIMNKEFAAKEKIN